MSVGIEQEFKEKNLSSTKVSEYKLVYEYVEKEFKRKFFRFQCPNKDISDKEYYEILKLYLKNNGYGYGAKRVGQLIDKDEKNDVELSKLLMDLSLINRFNKDLKIHGIDINQPIEYDSNNGLSKTFKIEYRNIIGFKIQKVSYKNKAFISHKENKNEIEIMINIEKCKRVNLTETLAIYTNYGVDTIQFSLMNKEEKHESIEVNNIEEYLELCTNNKEKAKSIFNNEHFREWLEYKEYTAKLIDYDESVSISNYDNMKNAFNVFCVLNGIYNLENGEYDKLELEEVTITSSEQININDEEVVNYKETEEKIEDNKENKEAVDEKENTILDKIKKKIWGKFFKKGR